MAGRHTLVRHFHIGYEGFQIRETIMPATPADIAKYTSDGVVVSASNQTILDNFPDAIDGATEEIEMFYDNEADAQWAIDEMFAVQSTIAPPHLGIEMKEGLGLGTSVPVAPQLPSFLTKDARTDLSAPLRVISYAYEMGSDRTSVELHA